MKESMISIRERNQNEKRVKVFNINSTDLLILTTLLTGLKLDGYLNWSWLKVVNPISVWWLFVDAKDVVHTPHLLETGFTETSLVQGAACQQLSSQFVISRSTVFKWLARYRSGGEAALHNGSPRPRMSPRRMPVERVAAIAALRRRRKSSLDIAFSLSLPLSSVTLELRRLGLNKLSRLEPKAPIVRYEHEKPGDMIHLDIKKLGRIDGVGHRITNDRSKRGRKAGCEYLHVCGRQQLPGLQ